MVLCEVHWNNEGGDWVVAQNESGTSEFLPVSGLRYEGLCLHAGLATNVN